MREPDHTGERYQDYLPAYLISIHPGGRAIYLITIATIFIVLACLPIVSIQVSVSGRGIIRPIQEKTSIIAASSGIVAKVYVNEGDRIRKSDPLVQIGSAETQQNLNALTKELKEAMDHARDLSRLTKIPLQIPATLKYRREYEEYLNRTEYLELIHSKAMRELSRYESLFRDGLISEKDYDDLVFEENRSRKEMESLRSQSLADWQQAYHVQMNRVREIQMRIRNFEEKIRLTTVYAPATGSMIEFKGIFEGSAVQAGKVLGVLSPESGLIGEFYISSENMAYLRKGQKVHLHMDAFNAREWGIVPGRIYEISSDFLMLENQPVYRAKCMLEQNSLQLGNGYSAELKKGMTFQARCLVARRTLFQLLSDKTNNWLNPVMNSQEFNLLP